MHKIFVQKNVCKKILFEIRIKRVRDISTILHVQVWEKIREKKFVRVIRVRINGESTVFELEFNLQIVFSISNNYFKH